MKKIIGLTALILMILMLILSVSACDKINDAPSLWENATYGTDTTLGEGANTVKVEITADGKTIILTLKTDKATLGEALYELKLVNNPSFFDVCNGMKADWDKDKAYWAFYVDEETAMASYGIGDEKAVTTGEHSYRIVYTK